MATSLTLGPLAYVALHRSQTDATPDPSSGLAMVAATPVQPQVTEVPLSGDNVSIDRSPLNSQTFGRGAVSSTILSAPQPVSGYGTVGVTWLPDPDEGLGDVQVYARTELGGDWSDWVDFEYDAEHGPDLTTSEGRATRAGTDPFPVGEVDAVQVKVVATSNAALADLQLAVIDPREPSVSELAAPAIASGNETDITMSAQTQGATPEPAIFSRSQWGADESMRDRSSLHYGHISVGFVHHTVNANDYTRDEVPALLRGIYAYHTQSKGWSDIGYNFVVDRFGRIWEGRYGGVDRPVVGAHTLGYNEDSFAMSALGNFETARPSADMLDAYARLFAWKLSISGIDPTSKQTIGSDTFNAISGHRDAGSTACPGRYLYDKLSVIREQAAAIEPATRVTDRDANLSGSPWPDVVLRDRASGRAAILETGGQLGFSRQQTLRSDWSGKDLLVAAGDVDGDGKPDLLARSSRTGRSRLFGISADGLSKGPSLGDAFASLDQLTRAGDLSGDGRIDLVGRDAKARLFLYPGTGEGSFGRRLLLASDWASYDLTTGVGDLTGDGSPDLVARQGDTLFVIPGGDGKIGSPVPLPGSWAGFSSLVGTGDFTNDHTPDLLATDRDGQAAYIYRGDGQGGLRPHPFGPFAPLSGAQLPVAVRSLDPDKDRDLVMRTSDGALVAFINNGAQNISGIRPTTVDLRDTKVVVNVGDWNRDGRGDLLTRQPSTGALQLRPGTGSATFGAPQIMRSESRGLRGFVPVGDMDGDGAADLVVTDRESGVVRLMRGDGQQGFNGSRTLAAYTAGSTFLGVGRWDSDKFPDLIERTASDQLVLRRSAGFDKPLKAGRGIGSAAGFGWMRSISDANGDSRPDLVARKRSTGDLWLLPGANRALATPTLVADDLSAYRPLG